MYSINFTASGKCALQTETRGRAKIINSALAGAGITAETTVNKVVDFTKVRKSMPRKKPAKK